MTLADVVDAMRAAGCSNEQIGSAVATLASKPRNRNAIRQAKFREKSKVSVTVTPSVTPNVTPSPLPPFAPPRDINSTPPLSTDSPSPDSKSADADLLSAAAPTDLLGDVVKAPKRRDPINGHATELVDKFVAGWDAVASNARLPVCRAVSEARRAAILARARNLVEAFDYPTPEAGFVELFAKIRGSPFLLGRTSAWKCDLDWIVKEANFLKIMEGKYAPDQKPIVGGNGSGGAWAGPRH